MGDLWFGFWQWGGNDVGYSAEHYNFLRDDGSVHLVGKSVTQYNLYLTGNP
jgi:hypothetical protein